jgi:hypothetical protein
MRCDSGTVIGNKVDTEHRNENVYVCNCMYYITVVLFLCNLFLYHRSIRSLRWAMINM